MYLRYSLHHDKTSDDNIIKIGNETSFYCKIIIICEYSYGLLKVFLVIYYRYTNSLPQHGKHVSSIIRY